ncbi:MAG: M48 family metallopeptidase [Candidatus Cryptobacteroides sp.]
MNKKIKSIAAFSAAAILLTACGTVAFTGRKQVLLFSDSDITSLSEQSYTEFMQTAKESSDASRTAMLVEVGRRMTAALESYLSKTGQNNALMNLSWDFKLVESSEVNAFCMPSGKIVFYEGIMPIANTPDYIAVVMGHEMAHAIAKHGNERMSQEVAMNALEIVASQVIGQMKGENAQNLFDIGFNIGSQLGVLLPYSRKHEYEADRIGLYLMAIAGYDIEAAPQFWEKMSAGGKASSNDFFSTHPCDSKRVAALKEALPDARNYIAAGK